MSLDELDTLERERRDADRRYNDALTAFDAALVRATLPRADVRLVADATPPPAAPSGWRGRWPARRVSGGWRRGSSASTRSTRAPRRRSMRWSIATTSERSPSNSSSRR